MNNNSMDFLINTAEERREDLGDVFFTYRAYMEENFDKGLFPEPLHPYSHDAPDWQSNLIDVILQEMTLFLCTDDAKYEDVRAQGRIFTKLSIPSIGGYVAGSCGVEVGIATSAVAFIAISIIKISSGVFCRLTKS